MIFTKGAHHSSKFQTSDCSGEISPNLYFDRLLLLKVYKVSAKQSMEGICLMIPKCGAKFEEKLIFCFKNDKNLVNFDPSTLIGPFCAKYTTFHLKKYRRVIFHDTEESCKIWRKMDLWSGNYEEFGKFSSEHLKVSKLLFSWDHFAQSIKCMSYKRTEEL